MRPRTNLNAPIAPNLKPASQKRRFTKISISESKTRENPVAIEYERDVPGGETEIVRLPGNGAPHPDFQLAMDALLETAIAVCRLSADDWSEVEPHVISLSIKHVDGELGVTISILGKFTDDEGVCEAVNVGTPYLSPDRLSTGEIIALEAIFGEAEEYINGKRAQMSLFEQPEVAA